MATDTGKKLDHLLDVITQIQTILATQQVTLSHTTGDLLSLNLALKGNGKTGLETRMAIVEENLKRINTIGAFLLLAILGDVITRILAR